LWRTAEAGHRVIPRWWALAAASDPGPVLDIALADMYISLEMFGS